MKLKGRVWKFGDNVDTDLIIPARFLNVSDKFELARNCFADHRPEFIKGVKEGDIIVAGSNFGCGSSREHAPLAIKTAGISVVIAESYARIFYRNAFNIGLPILELKGISTLFEEGSVVSVDLSSGEITGQENGKSSYATPIPEFMTEIIQAGGLVNYVRKNGFIR
ncbi:3-isopropylmalate dehydratase small subunit [Thermodesulfobacteriota bacterium]